MARLVAKPKHIGESWYIKLIYRLGFVRTPLYTEYILPVSYSNSGANMHLDVNKPVQQRSSQERLLVHEGGAWSSAPAVRELPGLPVAPEGSRCRAPCDPAQVGRFRILTSFFLCLIQSNMFILNLFSHFCIFSTYVFLLVVYRIYSVVVLFSIMKWSFLHPESKHGMIKPNLTLDWISGSKPEIQPFLLSLTMFLNI